MLAEDFMKQAAGSGLHLMFRPAGLALRPPT